MDPAAERPYLALYPLEDLGFLQTDEFKAVPVHHETVPAPSHAIFDVTDFDTRYYEHVQTYEGLSDKGAGYSSPFYSNSLCFCSETALTGCSKN